MTTNEIQATGFNHWILGSADMTNPLAMPTQLPYAFSNPDEYGRVPYADVVLASGYQWAMNPMNGYYFHTPGNKIPYLSDEEAVARCMLRPYMHAVYGAQRFIRRIGSDPNRGKVDTAAWRKSIARYLLKESGVAVSWIDRLPEIAVVRDLEGNDPVPALWNMVDVDLLDDGRAEPLGIGEQSPAAMLPIFSGLKNVVWTQRLLKIDE